MAVLAGASLPPITACIRALYPRLVTDPALLQTAYSIDSVLVETVFILGPALVAVCVAAGHPEAAVLLAALSAVFGTTFFMRAGPVGSWIAAPNRARRDWTGVLRFPKLALVFGVTVLYSFAFGLFEVAVTAHAAAKGAPAVAGIALALASVGSGVGAFVYGARHWRAPLRVQFVVALIAMAAGTLLLVPIDDLVLYAAASLVAGVPMATVIATQSLLVSRLAPRERLAEASPGARRACSSASARGSRPGGDARRSTRAWWLLVIAGGSTAAGGVVAAACLRGGEVTRLTK